MTRIRHQGQVYVQTTVQIPEELRDDARTNKIGLSATLIKGLKTELEFQRRLSKLVKTSANGENETIRNDME